MERVDVRTVTRENGDRCHYWLPSTKSAHKVLLPLAHGTQERWAGSSFILQPTCCCHALPACVTASRLWRLQAQATAQQGAEPAMLKLAMWLEPVGVLEAAVALGVEPAAAQSCLAMCAAPGGVFLDIKSAYSSAADIQLFCGAMLGVGIHCKVRGILANGRQRVPGT